MKQWVSLCLVSVIVHSLATGALVAQGVRIEVLSNNGGVVEPPPVRISARRITLSQEPTGAGILEGPESAISGTAVRVQATPLPGSAFSYWSVRDYWSERVVSLSPSYSFFIWENTSLVAHFVSGLRAESLDAVGGIVNGSSPLVKFGEIYTVNALPNRWYKFDGWYKMVPDWTGYRASELVSDDATFSFVSDGIPTFLGSKFTFIRRQFDLTLVCDPPRGGTLIGVGNEGRVPTWANRVLEEDLVAVSTEAVPGYKFIGWRERSGTSVNTLTNFIVPTADSLWTAYFFPTCAVGVVNFQWDLSKGLRGNKRVSSRVDVLEVPAGTNVVLHAYPPPHGFSWAPYISMRSMWKRSGRRLAEESNTLTLSNVTRRDSGTYRFAFVLDDKYRLSTSMVRLRVIEPKRRPRFD